jgi:hypothetical protein
MNQQFTRGHRVELLRRRRSRPCKAVGCPETERYERLAQGLSLIFGVEVLIVLKDIWGLSGKRTMDVAQWAAAALVRAAIAESTGSENRVGIEEVG